MKTAMTIAYRNSLIEKISLPKIIELPYENDKHKGYDNRNITNCDNYDLEKIKMSFHHKKQLETLESLHISPVKKVPLAKTILREILDDYSVRPMNIAAGGLYSGWDDDDE